MNPARALLASLWIASLAAAEHDIVTLECPPSITYRLTRDMNGDGLEDVVIVAKSEAWIWFGRKTGWTAQPDRKEKLPDGAAIFDVGPEDQKAQQIHVRTAKNYFAMFPRREVEFVSGPGLPVAPDNVLWRGLFEDFDADGRTDRIDVSLDGYRIAYAAGGTTSIPPLLIEKADTDADASSERQIARYAIGDWTVGDFNGDQRRDFAVLTKSGLLVYPGDAKQRHDASRQLVITIAEAEDADLKFIDFNGDGRMDVLATRRKIGKATIMISTDKGLLQPRRVHLAVPGHMRLPFAADLNGDGRPDMALPYTQQPSVQDAVRVLLRGEVLLKVPLFLNQGGSQPIPRLATRQLTIPLRIRIGSDDAGRLKLSGLVIVEYSGDVDGDGRNDLLVTEETDRLGVHRGQDSTIFEEEPSSSIPVPDCANFELVKSAAANLNGDDRSDIILHYRGGGGRPDQLHLLISRTK